MREGEHMSEPDPSGHAAEAHHAEVNDSAGTQVVGTEARPLVNAGKPVASATCSLGYMLKRFGEMEMRVPVATWACAGEGCEQQHMANALGNERDVLLVATGKATQATCRACGQIMSVTRGLIVQGNSGPNRHQRRASRHE